MFGKIPRIEQSCTGAGVVTLGVYLGVNQSRVRLRLSLECIFIQIEKYEPGFLECFVFASCSHQGN